MNTPASTSALDRALSSAAAALAMPCFLPAALSASTDPAVARPLAPRHTLNRWFERDDLMDCLLAASKAQMEDLPFEVIGFDRDRLVQVFNRVALGANRCSRVGVIGRALFAEVGREFDNALVAGRFSAAIDTCSELDLVQPYMLVRFERLMLARVRLLARPGCALRFVVVAR